MKNYGTITLLVATALSAGAALLLLPDSDTERSAHYVADKPQSLAAAQQQLRDALSQTTGLLAQARRDTTARMELLEGIHEHSYALESVADYLLDTQTGPPQLRETFDEAVQALHYASEKQNLADTIRWHGVVETQAEAIAALRSSDIVRGSNARDNTYRIVIKDHRFTPETVSVPAGQKIKLLIDNQDATPEEFESHDLAREKIIAGNSQAIVLVGPLTPGQYHFFGEFNMDTANGYVIAE